MVWQDIWVVAARAGIAYLLALLATRLLNKQFVARLTYFDFTVGVLVGALAGHVPNDYERPFWPVVTPLVVVTVLGILTGWLAMKIQPIRHLLQGEPTVVVQNGKVLDENMRRLRYNLDQLNSQLRASGFFDISTVEFAVLEPGGQLSVLPKSQNRPAQTSDLGVSTPYEGMAIELIMDGQVVHKNLRENGLSEQWLMANLQARGISSPAEVYYCVLNTKGQLFIDRYADRLHRPVDIEGRNPSTPPSPSLLP